MDQVNADKNLGMDGSRSKDSQARGAGGCEHLNKRDFELLGRVFEAEILNYPVAQIGKSKTVASLSARGYIEPMTVTLPGRFPVTVSGWRLTEAGRFTYCLNCTGERVPDPPEVKTK